MQIIDNKINISDKKVFIYTFGCQMNVHDSEKILGAANDLGYAETKAEQDADLFLINTCCIREHAEDKVYSLLGYLKKYKSKNPSLIIGICGCMMQQKNMSDHIKKRFPHVDIIFGTHNLSEFPKMLNKKIEENLNSAEVWQTEGTIVEYSSINRADDVRAWVNITYGCNNYCSYCIVPYVRGRERSRLPENLIKEVTDLVNKGYKEVCLLGQNVNSYGKDLNIGYTFPDLLRDLDKTGIARIRFMTSHPKDLSDDLIDAMATCRSVCEHIHLPLQSGSDRILKLMNRKYDKAYYLNLVAKIRARIPDIAITTDIIVGFPGETEEDFMETYSLCKEIEFDAAFTFKYSQREGTPAAKMADQIPREVKEERLEQLNQIIKETSIKRNKDYEGKVVEVLVEGFHKKSKDYVIGRTRTNKTVHLKEEKSILNNIITVKITKVFNWTLRGELIK